MFRKSKLKLTDTDIEMACCLFNSCGKYMFHHPAYHNKAKLFLESLFRVKARIATDGYLCSLIDEAYYRIYDFSKAINPQKIYTVAERFIQHLIFSSLSNDSLFRVIFYNICLFSYYKI